MHLVSIACRYAKSPFQIHKFNCFGRQFTNKTTKPSNKSLSKRSHLLEKDKVPQQYELIYHAPMRLYITMAKNISTVTTILISSVALYSACTDDLKIPTSSVDSWGLVSQPNDVWYFSFGFIIITIAIRVFIARYPLRIYCSKESYIAIFDSQFNFGTLKHMYCRNEVKTVESKYNPWSNCTHRLGNRTSLILSQYFRTPADYNQMMGYY